MVGTNWALVTWCRSMAAKHASGSHRSITTVVAPVRWASEHVTTGAVW